MHVVPVADAVVHAVPGDPDLGMVAIGPWVVVQVDETEPDPGCVCRPTPEFVPNDDGPDGWLFTHHALDGREAREQAGGRASSS